MAGRALGGDVRLVVGTVVAIVGKSLVPNGVAALANVGQLRML